MVACNSSGNDLGLVTVTFLETLRASRGAACGLESNLHNEFVNLLSCTPCYTAGQEGESSKGMPRAEERFDVHLESR